MKLVTFVADQGEQRCGALIEDGSRIVDLQASHHTRWSSEAPALASVLAIAEGGANALDLAADLVAHLVKTGTGVTVARDAVRLDAPIPRPPQMRDFLCFEKHLVQAFHQARVVRARETPDPEAAMREMEAKGVLAIPAVWYERPIFYHPNRLNVVGPETEVVWPPYSQLMDFELEFGAYIGRKGRDIPKDKARDHIFGYTIFNDFSARDEQTREMPGQLGPGKGKDFDGGNAMGPCLVTADEIGDPYRLTMIARVNGEEWARGNSGEMSWTFEDCIAHASRSETIHPGEFFGSGTVGGGCGLETMRFLKSGDVVELEVEGIGVLRNRVVRAG
ncbi:fumarylacetoacetate hydrolase family protein [Bradyrhizobium prioriisuperbiae]|uniref:fumarylacetoacetate hydrolase family protein n=1 Tax=Bradyrhizobium prioriisuperbiae TaxID=2854389 RepID=UPI0028E43FB5|nr:fumarylacetoacetate hydrolase family protein [Bradyrhizobium prioritasuperba]